MFVLVLGMNYSGLTERLAAVLVTDRPILSVGVSSFFAANLINNIPMSVLFSSVLETVTDPEVYRQGVFAAVVGSNIGAYLTPVARWRASCGHPFCGVSEFGFLSADSCFTEWQSQFPRFLRRSRDCGSCSDDVLDIFTAMWYNNMNRILCGKAV